MARFTGIAQRVALAAFLATGAAPTIAQPTDLLSKTTVTCLQIPADRAVLVRRVATLGWHEAPSTDLPTTARNGYAALQLSLDMAYGEAPKARWLSSWSAGQKNATGLKNLAQIPDSRISRLFFVSEQGSYLQVILHKRRAFTSIACSMALVPTDMALVLVAFNESLGSQTRAAHPTFARSRGGSIEDNQIVGGYSLLFADSTKISALIDAPFNYTGIASTHLREKPPTR